MPQLSLCEDWNGSGHHNGMVRNRAAVGDSLHAGLAGAIEGQAVSRIDIARERKCSRGGDLD
jgi:hypothetical protein